MARPQKSGLDYFALDVNMSDEVEIIEAEHGLVGFAILIKLYQKIYSEGYFYEWGDKEQILFSNRVSVDRNTVVTIVADCIKWNIFDNGMYEKYNILTSRRMQNHYVTAVYKRINVEVVKEYLLIDVSERNNLLIVSVNGDTDKDTFIVSDISNEDTTIVSDDKSTQSKVKESKVKESKEDIYALTFEELWKLYPNKKSKASVNKATKRDIHLLGIDKVVQAINNYKEELEINTWQAPLHGSTFFNSRYVDYLEGNYTPPKGGSKNGEHKGNNGGTTPNSGGSSEETLRLERIAKEAGLIRPDGSIEDIGEVDF